jgi:hypothetical protein
MTATARKILSDLQVAKELLQAEQSSERFRVLWVSSVALCRAIGHALQKVDSGSSPKLRSAIQSTYESWKASPELNHLFFEFIEDERNSVLKEYEFGFMSGAGTVSGLVLPDGLLETLTDNFFCPMIDGRFAGVDCRDVLELAVNWWQQQLDVIDRAVAA